MNESGTPRVTFIVPCYNYGRYVTHAIDSALEQTLTDLEIIAINDCSSDDTADILAGYEDERVRVINHEQNIGNIATYNEGLQLARGDYVGVLSADDYCLRPDAIERQVEAFESDHDIGLVYTAYRFVDPAGDSINDVVPHPEDYIRNGLTEFRELILWNYIPHSGTLVRRSCHEELGLFDPRFPHAGDWELWLRIAARHRVAYLADVCFAYRLHETNMSVVDVRPHQATGEYIEVVEEAFAYLPDQGARELAELRRPATRRALLNWAWNDRAHGRVGRSWQGLADAARREPSLLLAHDFYGEVGKTALLTAVGYDRYVRLVNRRHRRTRIDP